MIRAAAWFTLLCPALLGAGESAPPVWRVRAEVQMVALPIAEAARLRPRLGRSETFAAACARVQAMLQSGEATLLGWPVTEGRAESPSLSESGLEIRFPTEFRVPDQTTAGFVSPSTPVFPFPTVPPAGTDSPTAFETRETGPSLQTESGIDPESGRIRLKLVARFVRLIELRPAIGARAEPPVGLSLTMPRFLEWSVDSSLTIPNGGGLLLGAFLEGGERPRMIVFLLHATAKSYSPALP